MVSPGPRAPRVTTAFRWPRLAAAGAPSSVASASPVAITLAACLFASSGAAAAPPVLRLRVLERSGAALAVALELTAEEEKIAAVGARIAYDPAVLAVSGLSAVAKGEGLPPSWSAVYADVSAPGEIDIVYTDISSAAALIPGPVAGIEAARIRFDVVGPCPDFTAVGFSEEAPVTPQQRAAFPANRYLSVVDPAASEVDLIPAEPDVVRPAFVLKAPVTSGPELVARLEATALEGPTAAFGVRLAYDASVLAIDGVSAIEAGSAVPSSWSPVYANASSPGEVDFVFTDISSSPATIPGPLAGTELCRVRFRVVRPPPAMAHLSFSDEPPSTPQEAAAFPANRYLEYLDPAARTVCLLPVEGTVAEEPLPQATAKLVLRLPTALVNGDRILAHVELTTDAPETTAFGLRLTYDPMQVALGGPEGIAAGPGTPPAWTPAYVNAGAPGKADFVFTGNPATEGTIAGPVAGLHVATVDFGRVGRRPDEGAFGFSEAPPSTPAEAAAFPYNQFIRFRAGGAGNVARADVSVAASRGDFLRGDCNGDGDLDISDPVWHLNYLFRGGPAPPCDEACNANFDASLDISDPIYTINSEFLGGPPPAPPYPACDASPYCALPTCP
ncbi:MAG: hypothetical protein HY721_32880 [Planctomycetes bacterium]|nr:hypothetical protein [Planctomycetota bacterium]